MITQANLYEQVTNEIIKQLETGVAPWKRPWTRTGSGMPANISGRAYRGINVLLLWAAAQSKGFDSHFWGTFRQWKERGGYVRCGEKGTRIVFWKIKTDTVVDPRTGEEQERKQFFPRNYTVFNIDQCGGISLDKPQPEREFLDFRPAEEAIIATGADIRHGGGRAFFNPTMDYVQVPIKGSFNSEAAYYSTTLHEMIHWSGHESRLNRINKLARFGSASYAAEELVAELGSAFLTAALDIPNAPIQDNAAYLQSWLSVLRNDSRAIFTASTVASAAADYVLSFSREVEPEESEEMEAVVG